MATLKLLRLADDQSLRAGIQAHAAYHHGLAGDGGGDVAPQSAHTMVSIVEAFAKAVKPFGDRHLRTPS